MSDDDINDARVLVNLLRSKMRLSDKRRREFVAAADTIDALLAERDDLVQAHHILTAAYYALRAELNLALDRITDTLDEGDDGRGWREAEKFLARHRPQEVSR